MKFCTQCGAQLEDNSRFCTNCGTPVGQTQQAAPQEQSWDNWNAPQQPVPGYVPGNQQPPKKNKTGLIIGLVVGIVAVIVLAIVFLFAGKDEAPAPAYTEAPAIAAPAATEAPVAEAPAEAPAAPAPAGADVTAWNGDYYGWWIINELTYGSGEGNWYEAGNWWDACASVNINSDGSGNVIIWDEDLPKDNAVCEIKVNAYVKDGVLRLSPISGYFMDGNIVYNDIEILVDWDDDYDDVLTVFGSYSWDEAGFDYYMFMRPWGHNWADVKAQDPGLLPYYMDWYESLIASGASKAPNNIGN